MRLEGDKYSSFQAGKITGQVILETVTNEVMHVTVKSKQKLT